MDSARQAAGLPPGDWHAPAAGGPVRARLRLPGSKSMTNRALVLASLADRATVITGPLRARDTDLMAAALRGLGTVIEASPEAEGDLAGASPAWRVLPARHDGDAAGGGADIDVGNAGTVLRFMPPVAALTSANVAFHGDDRASRRPVGQLIAALRQLGAVIDDGGRGAVPFTVRGSGAVRGGTVTLDASGSSQLISGLLLAAPRYDKGAEIRHEGPRVPSAPHIAMTVQMLRGCGADVEAGGRLRGGTGADPSVSDVWRVHPGVLTGGHIAVEPDLSNSAPFLAAAMVTGGSVTITDWPAGSLQPASLILGLLTRMGATCTPAAAGMAVTGTGEIRGITADLRDISELAPVLTALAAVASSPSVFTGIGHLRMHESDRLAALSAEIGALGGQVTERADGLEITPRPLRGEGVVFASHDDHRLVMAAAVLGLAAGGLRVGGAATVAKTFPGFFGLWAQMLERSP